MPDHTTQQITRTVVITGGTRGIGRAICLAFAGPDTRIYFNYSSSVDAAAEIEKIIGEAGGFAKGMQVDIMSGKDVESFFGKILEESGRIDVLVNNAGIARDGLLVRMKEKDWDDVLDTNLKGAFLCTKIAAKPMIKQRYGRIINISSVVGASGNPGQANYVASKAGIIGFTKAVAKELASREITVNAVAPGFVETDMTGALSEKAKEVLINGIPIGRIGKPEDIAAAVLFLASKSASYITGQVIHVNGGMYM
ncbi:MAG: 3-oxoacyl-[acyl-carrier-protein] reductase [Desulfobacterium sp.]|nr:3-oxoacyl-[acyl-carrier-protein] reductase [Desulfobacterium sp.]MBU3947774.1 3-oxoacyl-[acyl-carrier-protein] reductase [Pseudomonadota bacterium]MBU4010423.1 3-oxoacyl-[acyl-carrier-protein] reductase [Pseudomonadota bacterium]